MFDSAGVGRSTGKVPPTVTGMAAHAFDFLDGLGLENCDVLGFSLGGMVAQQMVLDRASIFRRMILVGTAPRGGEEAGGVRGAPRGPGGGGRTGGGGGGHFGVPHAT